MEQFLKAAERATLIKAHRAERDKRQADRIKTILYLDEGKAYGAIAKLLFLDDSTLRRYEREYEAGGLDALLEDHYRGGISTLSAVQEEELVAHLRDNLYSRAKGIVAYVNPKYGVVYTPTGRVHLLHRIGFSYKRVWKFFHKKITYNQYYATYSKFKITSLDFFENILQYKEELDTLLTENFHIIGKQISQT